MSHAAGTANAASAPTPQELQHQLLMYAQDLHDLMQQQSQLQRRYRTVLQSHARSDQCTDMLVNAVRRSCHLYLVTDHLGCISQASDGAASEFAADGRGLEGRFVSQLAASGEDASINELLNSLLGANATGAIQQRQLCMTHTRPDEAQQRYGLLVMPVRKLDRLELYWLFSPQSSADHPTLEAEKFLTNWGDASESLMVASATGVICAVNPAFSRITGFSAAEVVGQNPRLLNSGRHEPDFYRAFWAHLMDDGSWTGEFFNRNKSGHIYTEWQTVKAVKDAGGTTIAYLCATTDISHRASEAEENAKLAYHDTLTGLGNQRHLQERLAQAIGQPCDACAEPCLLLIELDEFRLIEEAFGSEVSDRLLQDIAARLQAALPDGASLARTAPDSFAILLHGPADEVAARQLADELRRRLLPAFRVDEQEVSVGSAIGCARHPQHGADLSTLLRRAATTLFEPSRYATL
jgi:diguanylate cyclase (GGDEF)-like protein/PAS domain S-box-containing protein